MSDFLLWSVVLLWLLALAEGAVILALLRQTGLIHLHLQERSHGLVMTEEGIALGSKAPPFLAQDVVSGDEVMLQAFQGSPVVLLFVSPGCNACRALMRDLTEQDQPTDDVRWIAITAGSESDNKFFAEVFAIRVPLLLDSREHIAADYGVPGRPFVYILDAEGNVETRGAANDLEDVKSMLSGLDAVRASQPAVVELAEIGQGGGRSDGPAG